PRTQSASPTAIASCVPITDQNIVSHNQTGSETRIPLLPRLPVFREELVPFGVLLHLSQLASGFYKARVVGR
ncbi:MAG: hypothetical protein ACRYF2_00200, partial [Janthinobacterium lividum]